MDFWDAISDILKKHPELDAEDLRSVMDLEVAYEERELSGQRKYARAVEAAHRRMLSWLEETEQIGKLDLSSPIAMAGVVAKYRTACLWAVLQVKARLAALPSR